MKTIEALHKDLISQIKALPKLPGVYLYKNPQGEVVYVGKAKDLKARGLQYVQSLGADIKTDTIFSLSTVVDCITTDNELEALLLEARLIQSYQPRCNILLKTGQPFVYIFVASNDELPRLEIVRNQRKKGSYFGPFLEKGTARKVYDFLIRTFVLTICNKKIESGCIFYHMGKCAGSCRSSFDKEGYLHRLELAKKVLRQGHKKFIDELKNQIVEHNKNLEFEKSQELHKYIQSFERVFSALESKNSDHEMIALKHIWILAPDKKHIAVFQENQGVLKRQRLFVLPFDLADEQIMALFEEYFSSFYQITLPPGLILINCDYPSDQGLMESFLKEWHNLSYTVSIVSPQQGHLHNLVRLALAQATQDIDRQANLSQALKVFLKLPHPPKTIDCFDISHKQGQFMVGACVRFTDGAPDKQAFRRFHIKTVEQIDDYASLREIVGRRYKDRSQLPDLVVIDGGKGQLNAVADLFPATPFISLAKREETVFSEHFPEGKKVDEKSYVGQLLIALRDYTHHFAISFHKQIETLDR